MPPRLRFLYATLTATVLLIAAVPLYRELTRRRDIWWTPPTMLVPLSQSADRVEIYVRGQPLAALLQSGRLRVVDGAGTTSLGSSDVALRFNNLDRARAARLPGLLVTAAVCGAGVLLLLLVITGRLAYRAERRDASFVAVIAFLVAAARVHAQPRREIDPLVALHARAGSFQAVGLASHRAAAGRAPIARDIRFVRDPPSVSDSTGPGDQARLLRRHATWGV